MIHEDFTRYHQIVGTYTAFSIFCILIAYAVTLLLGLLSLTSPAEPIGDPYFSLMEILIIVLAPLLGVVLVAAAVTIGFHDHFGMHHKQRSLRHTDGEPPAGIFWIPLGNTLPVI